MRTTLKNWMIALVCAVTFSATAHADNEKPINVSQLPSAAQQIIQKNFASHKVALAKVESGLIEKSYDVIFTNGDKLEFDRNGKWTEISCKTSSVPSALVPATIAQYVTTNYPGTNIVQIERDRKEYDVKLSTGLEITFNSKYQVIDIDN